MTPDNTHLQLTPIVANIAREGYDADQAHGIMEAATGQAIDTVYSTDPALSDSYAQATWIDRDEYDQTNPGESGHPDTLQARLTRFMEEAVALTGHPDFEATPEHRRITLGRQLHQAAWWAGEARNFHCHGLMPNPVQAPVTR